jgi:predicted nucleic acid-binding protein
MNLVLDVSAAVEILLRKEKSDRFDAAYRQSAWVIAPDLYVAELSNTLWKYHKAGVLSREECVQYGDDGLALVDDFFEAKDLWKEALSEGIQNSHPVYDLFYLTLARRHAATLLTNDRRLADLACQAGVGVVF